MVEWHGCGFLLLCPPFGKEDVGGIWARIQLVFSSKQLALRSCVCAAHAPAVCERRRQRAGRLNQQAADVEMAFASGGDRGEKYPDGAADEVKE